MRKILLLILFATSGCFNISDTNIDPQISYNVRDTYLKSLDSPFAPLTHTELNEPWGREYAIGLKFAERLDLYKALFTFERASALLSDAQRQLEVDYFTLLCYYLGSKYADVVETFECTRLASVPPTFPPFNDLMLILYESYKSIGRLEKADSVLYLIEEHAPELYEKILLGDAIMHADIPSIEAQSPNEETKQLITCYQKERKSPHRAQTYNALLPGAGYYYLGQKNSALTALLLNGLFIAAAYELFARGHTAAGIIVTTFEAGWYFGGIYGAGQEAKLYNERVWEKRAVPLMEKEKYFPILNMRYAF